MEITQMQQSEAMEIADRWKYDGEYAFYDMTADPEDYEEMVTPEKRGNWYFSVFEGDDLTGFFCVERTENAVELGLGMRPDLTGQGKGGAFLAEILRFLEERFAPPAVRLSVAAFNRRAVTVYERAGFQIVGEEKVRTNGGIYDFIKMELDQSNGNQTADSKRH